MALIIFDAFAAESPAAAPATEVPGEGVPYQLSAEKMMMDNLLILGLLFFIFYFILIRPQQQRLKAHKKMLESLAKGTKVVTSGGLYGTIIKFEGDDIVVIEVAANVRVRVARSAITDTTDKAGGPETANDN